VAGRTSSTTRNKAAAGLLAHIAGKRTALGI